MEIKDLKELMGLLQFLQDGLDPDREFMQKKEVDQQIRKLKILIAEKEKQNIKISIEIDPNDEIIVSKELFNKLELHSKIFLTVFQNIELGIISLEKYQEKHNADSIWYYETDDYVKGRLAESRHLNGLIRSFFYRRP